MTIGSSDPPPPPSPSDPPEPRDGESEHEAAVRYLNTYVTNNYIDDRDTTVDNFRFHPDYHVDRILFREIIGTVTEVRARFDQVFTTGGIGPTHDDITSECVAAAFGVPWEPHPEAWARMERHYKPGEFNAARQRMATLPRGAALIDNPVSVAPGFSIGNVHVMAGVPRIMQAMFDALAPRLPGGRPVESRAVHALGLLEGDIAEGLATIQGRYPGLDLGSYPFYRAPGGGVALVAKGTDSAALDACIAEVADLVHARGKDPVMGEPPV